MSSNNPLVHKDDWLEQNITTMHLYSTDWEEKPEGSIEALEDPLFIAKPDVIEFQYNPGFDFPNKESIITLYNLGYKPLEIRISSKPRWISSPQSSFLIENNSSREIIFRLEPAHLIDSSEEGEIWIFYELDQGRGEIIKIKVKTILVNGPALSYALNQKEDKRIFFNSISYPGENKKNRKHLDATSIKIKNIGSRKLEGEIYTKCPWLKIKGKQRKGNKERATVFYLTSNKRSVINVEINGAGIPKEFDVLIGEIIIQSNSCITDQQQIVIPVIALPGQIIPKARIYPLEQDLGMIWRGEVCNMQVRIENQGNSDLHVKTEDLPDCLHIDPNEREKRVAPRSFFYINGKINTTNLKVGRSRLDLRLKLSNKNPASSINNNPTSVKNMAITVNLDVYCYFTNFESIDFGEVRRGEEKSREVFLLHSHDYLTQFDLSLDEKDEQMKFIFSIKRMNINTFKLICKPLSDIKPQRIETHLTVKAPRRKESFKLPLISNIIF